MAKAEQKTGHDSPRKAGKKDKECYLATALTEPYSYGYADAGETDVACPAPTSLQRAAAVRQAQRVFEDTAKAYCIAGSPGADECRSNEQECKAFVTGWSAKITGWHRLGARCFIDVETTAHIDCRCAD